MLRNFLKGSVVLSLLGTLLFISPQRVGALPPNPIETPAVFAHCFPGGKLLFKMTARDPNHKYFSIKVIPDNGSHQSIVDTNDYAGSVLTLSVTPGNKYWYFIKTITKDGQSSYTNPPYGTLISCPLSSPENLSSSYKDSYLALSWRPVKGAVRYAIRIDDTANAWNGPADDYISVSSLYDNNLFNEALRGFPPYEGDYVSNSITETHFRIKAPSNHKIVWRVYAVSEEYNFSNRTQETAYTRGR